MNSRLLAQIQTTKLGTFQSQSTIFSKFNIATDKSGTASTGAMEFLITEFISILTIVGGVAMIFYFVLAALSWITANGDTGKTDKARQQMIQAVTGMVILVAAYGIIGVIGNVLGLHLLSPGAALLQIVKP